MENLADTPYLSPGAVVRRLFRGLGFTSFDFALMVKITHWTSSTLYPFVGAPLIRQLVRAVLEFRLLVRLRLN